MNKLARLIYWVPVFGWMLKEAIHGSAQVKTLFLLNMIAIWVLAIFLFGYPAIIIPALVMVAIIFTCLLMITADNWQ